MGQLDLFRVTRTEYGDRIEPATLAGRNEPTSREAAEDLVASGEHGRQCQAVLDALRQHGGFTSAELAAIAALDRHLVARRLPDLERRGLARRGANTRRCGQTGRKALVWWAR